jgi:hypothetical protein
MNGQGKEASKEEHTQSVFGMHQRRRWGLLLDLISAEYIRYLNGMF